MTKTIILQVPVVLKFPAEDSVMDSFSKTATFALATAKKAFSDKGLEVQIDGAHAIVSYMDEGKLASFTMGGSKLDDRHFRIQADDEAGHALELSDDKGLTFDKVGSFVKHAVADKFGRAWVAGRAEKDQ